MKPFFLAIILAVSLLLPGSEVLSQPAPPGTRAERRINRRQRLTRNISPSEEYLLGRAVAARILNTHTLVQDPKLQFYLNEVGQTVARKSSRPQTYRGYHFAVLESPEPNAFACPGGLVLITRGLLKWCANEDELAAALAHEVAHVAHRDGLNAIVTSRLAEAAAARRLNQARERGGRAGELAALYEGPINEVFQAIVTNGYSRAAEWAADQEALVTLSRAGYNPEALATLLAKMLDPQKRQTALHRTHPPTALRLGKVKMQLQDLKSHKNQKVRDQRFQEQKI